MPTETTTEQAHTPEPWEADDFAIEAGPGSPAAPMRIAVVSDSSCFPCLDEGEVAKADAEALANARRIAAAVNACAGIPTEALEQGVVGELLTAVRHLVEWNRDPNGDGIGLEYICETAAAAIAKAEGR